MFDPYMEISYEENEPVDAGKYRPERSLIAYARWGNNKNLKEKNVYALLLPMMINYGWHIYYMYIVLIIWCNTSFRRRGDCWYHCGVSPSRWRVLAEGQSWRTEARVFFILNFKISRQNENKSASTMATV